MGLTQGRSYSNRQTETQGEETLDSQAVKLILCFNLRRKDTVLARHNFRFLYLPAPCLSKNLACYNCNSNTSWDECEKYKTAVVCTSEHDDVCIKLQYIGNDDTEKGYKEAFVKMCGQARLCTNKACQEKSKTCQLQVDCCHSDLCNVATWQTHETSTLLATVLAVLLCVLQLRCIF